MLQIGRTYTIMHLSFVVVLITFGLILLTDKNNADCPMKWGMFDDAVLSETDGSPSVDENVKYSKFFSDKKCLDSSLFPKTPGKKFQLNCDIKDKDEKEEICRIRNEIDKCNSKIITNCDFSSPYRTIDGSCNNKKHPYWGRSNTCLQRYLPAHYYGNESEPRRSVFGGPLPSARKVSLEVHNDLRSVNNNYTQIHMQWGQCVAHDVILSLDAFVNDSCCFNPKPDKECLPIEVDQSDPLYGSHNIRCLEFTRTPRCGLCSKEESERTQNNEQTAYLDASLIYGATDEVANELWNKTDGTLYIENHKPYGDFPLGVSEMFGCKEHDGKKCFLSGDVRVNVHPALTAFHIVLIRYHNVIVRNLKQVNPHWNGEKLYQEARKILGALMQMITYGSYLPLLLGNCLMNMWDLKVKEKGFTEYNDQLDPSIFTDFATGPMRFGHSTIPSIFPQYWDNTNNSFCLRNFYNYPFKFFEGQLDPLMKGMAAAQPENVDPALVVDVAGYFFLFIDNNVTGDDLAAISIQRGRDRGLPPYVKYLEYIFGKRILTYGMLRKFIPNERLKNLKKAGFKVAEDIGLYSGFLSEWPVKGGILGPVPAYMIAEVFHRIKWGDRFYFENKGVFTQCQLNEIRKACLAQMFCETLKIDYIQKDVFLRANSDSNPKVKCSEIPRIDYRMWKENYQC